MSQHAERAHRNGKTVDPSTPRVRSSSADSHPTTLSSPYPSPSPSPGAAPEPRGMPKGTSAASPPDNVGSNTSAPHTPDATSGSEHSAISSTTDGLTDRLFRSRPKGPVAAIFIHAGAGFHSTSNEHVHLEACSEAARLAMKFLKAGGTAVDAVEVAIKFLEDKEITNAGYGSNLSIDGIVEGDATIVDHLGRSGACGAVPMVKNPISLARLILDQSNVPLSLRRIPPNILVGTGAKRFAEEHGMPLVPNDRLISVSARDRFCRWKQDLMRAEMAAIRHNQIANYGPPKTTPQVNNIPAPPRAAAPTTESGGATSSGRHSPPAPPEEANPGSTQQHDLEGSNAAPHQAAMQHMPSQSSSSVKQTTPQQQSQQPVSKPATSSAGPLSPTYPSDTHTKATIGKAPVADTLPSQPSTINAAPCPPRIATPYPKRPRTGMHGSANHDGIKRPRRSNDDNGDGSNDGVSQGVSHSTDGTSPAVSGQPLAAGQGESFAEIGLHDGDTDVISDTVGAIAVDLRGNIAAGSSSGGIGMKHSGRIGPAALVGIGTAVVPVNPKDNKGTSVAAVTSGTGEHMATTMASHTCAERIYYGLRRTESGPYVEEYNEDVLMQAFVANDFMNHPGVKNQISRGALGVMAAKKTNKGIYFYFAHNTDSFALASMASNEEDPLVVMSRMGPQEGVARGGRKIKS